MSKGTLSGHGLAGIHPGVILRDPWHLIKPALWPKVPPFDKGLGEYPGTAL